MVVRNNQRQGNNRPQPSEAEATVNESLGLDLQNLGDEGNEDDDAGADDDVGGGDDDVVRGRGQERDDDVGEGDDDQLGDETGHGQEDENPLVDLTRRVSHTAPKEPQLPKVKQDKKGNLIDASGKIIARAGAEARFYHDARKARAQVQELRTAASTQIRDVSSRLQEAIRIGTEVATELDQLRGEQKFVQDLGLSSNELREAASLMADSKKDPLAAIRKMLTMAAARGIDITQLGVQGNGVDTKSILDVVKAELAKGLDPLVKRETAETQRQRQLDEETQNKKRVETEVTTFFQNNTDARYFMPVFQSVMSNPANARKSLDHIWSDIQLHLLNSGKTVRGVIAQLTRGQQRGSQRDDTRRSIPRGRGSPQPGGNEGEDEMAPISASFDEIVKGALAKHSYGRTDV